MSEFAHDDAWGKQVRDDLVLPLYRRWCPEGRYVLADEGPVAERINKGGVDTILQLPGNRIATVDEKIVRWPGYVHDAYALEEWSCTVPGRERDGWMAHPGAAWLLYVFVLDEAATSGEAHLIPFARLQKWFYERDRFAGYRTSTTDQVNRSQSRLVPVADVWREVPGVSVHDCPSTAKLTQPLVVGDWRQQLNTLDHRAKRRTAR